MKANLSVKGKVHTVFVHNVVAEIFLPNFNKLPIVNHKDGNKQNNSVDNLEWCTAKYNSNHAHKLGLMNVLQGIQCTQSKLTKEDVLYLRGLYSPYQKLEYGVLSKLARQFGVSRHTIKNVIKHKTYKNI